MDPWLKNLVQNAIAQDNISLAMLLLKSQLQHAQPEVALPSNGIVEQAKEQQQQLDALQLQKQYSQVTSGNEISPPEKRRRTSYTAECNPEKELTALSATYQNSCEPSTSTAVENCAVMPRAETENPRQRAATIDMLMKREDPTTGAGHINALNKASRAHVGAGASRLYIFDRLHARAFGEDKSSTEERDSVDSGTLSHEKAPKKKASLQRHVVPEGYVLSPSGIYKSPSAEDYSPDSFFCETHSRLAFNGSGKNKFTVTKGEILRRIEGPECYTSSMVGGMTRRAKTTDIQGAIVKDCHEKLGVHIPPTRNRPGGKKPVKPTIFGGLCEEEALFLADGVQDANNLHFPRLELAALLADARRPRSLEQAQDRKFLLENAVKVLKEVTRTLEMDSSPVATRERKAGLHPYAQKELERYSMMTHGGGVPLIIAQLKTTTEMLEDAVEMLHYDMRFYSGMATTPRPTLDELFIGKVDNEMLMESTVKNTSGARNFFSEQRTDDIYFKYLEMLQMQQPSVDLIPTKTIDEYINSFKAGHGVIDQKASDTENSSAVDFQPKNPWDPVSLSVPLHDSPDLPQPLADPWTSEPPLLNPQEVLDALCYIISMNSQPPPQ